MILKKDPQRDDFDWFIKTEGLTISTYEAMSWISDTTYVADFFDQFEYPKASPYFFKMACKTFLSQYKLRLFFNCDIISLIYFYR